MVEVDREKVTPFLLRCFYGSKHHDDRDYAVDRLPPARDEHVLYTWKDTSLRDLVVLLLSSEQGAKVAPLGTNRYSIRHVFMDELRGYYVTKDLGLVFARDLARAPSEIRGTPSRTLDDIRFVVGDFLDIAFLAPDGPPRGPPGLGGGVGGGRDGPRTMSIRGSGAFADRGGRGGGFGGNGPRRGSRSPSPRRNMNGADGDWKR